MYACQCNIPQFPYSHTCTHANANAFHSPIPQSNQQQDDAEEAKEEEEQEQEDDGDDYGDEEYGDGDDYYSDEDEDLKRTAARLARQRGRKANPLTRSRHKKILSVSACMSVCLFVCFANAQMLKCQRCQM